MLARVRGIEIDQIEEVYYGRHENEVPRAISKRQAVHKDELLAENDVGRQILRLRAEGVSVTARNKVEEFDVLVWSPG